MVAAITVEHKDPLDAHRKLLLAVEGFDIFLTAVPPGPRFRDLVALSCVFGMVLTLKTTDSEQTQLVHGGLNQFPSHRRKR